MTLSRRSTLLAAPALLAPLAARAQGPYPDRPIRFIIPFAAGGGTSVIARIVTEPMAADLGKSFVIDNRPGAGGNVAAEVVAKSPPDGYTLFYGSLGILAINPSLYRSVPFDPIRDFTPISRMTTAPNVLVVHPDVPATNLQEFLALARARPGGINYGSGGSGTTTHLSGEMLKAMTGVEITHVPYRGDGPAVVDLLANRVQCMFGNLNGMAALIRQNQVRPIAITSLGRWPAAPDIPTFDEQGVKGYEISGWSGIVAPAGTPPAIIARLRDSMVAALKVPATRARLEELGLEPIGDTPEEFAAVLRQDLAKWREVVRASGATAD
ncbi:Bug family tripartite tricarboxylate transporter substrate binding protein [Pararoseomonas indoligenes]|uniref:Tripartite tricarboxylate transporter substrate binding protein n=1 Tax=Roseomonas indoligenes TaxID=2820811 RepID=A0A940N6L0_9PROT|nr:tripartite tricarboxylate transporter substrate binding protein [Pararoseomonas indoligenes]MBP0495067.1 tripartite tricarboxylate transporter substrate binding protein [Pararoseomonas indoligenes]